tara:strand:+ start:1381 stop:2202 length:822 start_codon:yes stop_codon:yes gene_type:complete
MKLLQSGWMIAILGVLAFGGVFFAANKFVLQGKFKSLNDTIKKLEENIEAAKKAEEEKEAEGPLTEEAAGPSLEEQRLQREAEEKRRKELQEAMEKATQVTGQEAAKTSEQLHSNIKEMMAREGELNRRIDELKSLEAQMRLQIKQFEDSDKKMMEDKQRELENLLKVRMNWIQAEETAKLQELATFWSYGITNTPERATTVVNTVMATREPQSVAKVLLYMGTEHRTELYTQLDGQGEEGAKLRQSIHEAYLRVTTNQPPVLPPTTNTPPQP